MLAPMVMKKDLKTQPLKTQRNAFTEKKLMIFQGLNHGIWTCGISNTTSLNNDFNCWRGRSQKQPLVYVAEQWDGMIVLLRATKEESGDGLKEKLKSSYWPALVPLYKFDGANVLKYYHNQ